MFLPKKQATELVNCFCCKIPLKIPRGYNGDEYIYFDKHIYHKDCFLKSISIKKKCYKCKKDKEVFNVNNNDLVYYDKHFYHKDCFIEWCNETKTKKRQFALENIDMFVEEANKEIEKLLIKKHLSKDCIEKYIDEAQKYIENWFDESDLCTYLKNEYEVTQVPYIYIRDVFRGTSKKTTVPIPPKDLLDMWEKKIDYLRNANQRLIEKSKHDVSAEMLIKYDLAILIKKYDSYLKWKRKQKLLELEKNDNDNFIYTSDDYKTIQKNVGTENNNESRNNDISDLVDDIFG